MRPAAWLAPAVEARTAANATRVVLRARRREVLSIPRRLDEVRVARIRDHGPQAVAVRPNRVDAVLARREVVHVEHQSPRAARPGWVEEEAVGAVDHPVQVI